MSDINWGLIRNGYTFQDLICALIRLEDHEARLYVRPGKDYAQDARSGDGRTIYQMKLHQNESTSSAIADAKKEAKKIVEYLKIPGKSQEIWHGVEQWILISNVAFNPSDEQKWIKEVKPLFDVLKLKAFYWEKSVIETHLLKYPDLKQAYFGGETRVFLGIAEAREQVQSQGFHCPNALNAHYQGRELELEQYKNFLLSDSKKILVIHGAGGIGKTRFLLEGAETQALPDGWQVLWANVATMMTTSSWFMGLIPELPTLLLIDEPDDATVLKTLVEQISGGRANTWKVAIAVRSPNDPVLKYVQGTRIRQIVEELPLTSLEENAAVALCGELLELGSLQTQTADWKTRAATWIAQHYDYYPIWMTIAIKLLESKGNLETMPQEADGLASEYLKEIITQQQNIPREQFLNILRWTALFDTVNREDTTLFEWIRSKVGSKNHTELQRYFDSMIARKVIFERGSHNRLLKIKPDILADHILRNWLTYRPSELNWKISDEAQEIVAEVSRKIDSPEDSSIQKLLLMILRRIARFELIQKLSNNPINLLGGILSDWYARFPMMNALQKLTYLCLLDEISFAHVSDVLKILKTVLNSTSEPETVSTIFGERIITHDDVILALPWIIYHTALCAQTDTEQMTILSLLCDLVIAERDIATRRPQGLPKDGKRAATVLPRVITGSPEFLSNFEASAFKKANELLKNIRSQGNISEDQKLHLDALVNPLLSIEKEYTLFDGRFIKSQRWTITPNQPEWKIRDSLRTEIKEILSDQKLQPAQALIIWNLLASEHGEINRVLLEVSTDSSPTKSEIFRSIVIQDLHWLVDFLNSHSLDVQELTAARNIWNWHYEFGLYPDLKEIATQCENFFKNSELFPQYAPLLRWESYEALGSWATEISDKLIASDNSQSIYDFVQNGVKFLGNSDQISGLFIVAEKLGTKAQQYPAVHKFVEEALQLPIETPEFQFTTSLCQGWIKTTRKDYPPKTIAVLEQLLQWVNTSEKSKKIVQLIQRIYGTGLINITEPEVALVLKQQEHFLQANSAVYFIGLLGGIFFYSSEEIKNIIEITLNKLEGNQLSSALDAFVQSLNYRMFPFTQNPEQTINPSLTNWILDQVLRLPNIDALDGITSEYLKEIFKVLGKPDLQWLVSAIETRIQMFSEADGSHIRILPSLERLSQWVTPISPEQADDTMIRNMIAKLLSYANSSPLLWYRFPRYLVDVDPNGVITADLVVEKLTDPKIRGNPRETWQWAKFAGYYPDDSPTWRKIAHEACSLAVQFDDSDKYSIFDALTNPDPKIWMSNIGEASPTFEKAVEIAQQRLESETAPVLIPFRQWILESAEAELSSEIERVKEEIDE